MGKERRSIQEKRDELAQERINLMRNPITGLCLEPKKRDELNKIISKLTMKIELPNL